MAAVMWRGIAVRAGSRAGQTLPRTRLTSPQGLALPTSATPDGLNTSQAIAAANGLTSFATMEANCSILVRDAEKAIIE